LHAPLPALRTRGAVRRGALPLLALALAACSANPGSGGPQAGQARAAATPAAAVTPPPTVPASGGPSGEPVTIAFGGDVHFMGSSGVRLANDPATAVGPMATVLRAADLSIVNLETAITTRGTPQVKTYRFRAPASAFTALRAAGIDIVTQANNHGMDFGLVGLRDSLDAAHAARFPVVGIGLDEAAAYAPHRVTVRGQRIAVLGATDVLDDNLIASWTAGPDFPGLATAKRVDRLVSAVRAARSDSDTVIVYLHYGSELHACPTERQRTLVRRLVEAGADILVGSHAHVLLGAGYYGNAYVDYGLGNFVFYVERQGPTRETGVLTLTVRGRTVTGSRWDPATIEGGAPRPLTGAAAAQAVRRWSALRSCTGLAPRPAG
jgi:poly-gamma-glutamate capsule biosynthesis protein CapA/YwtB (metallophosphatase superfamily)